MSALIRPVSRYDALPFIKTHPKRETGRDWWCVTPTGDAFADSALGEIYGRMLIAHYRRETLSPTGRAALVSIIHLMIEHQAWGQIEIGFLHEIDRHLPAPLRTTHR